MRHLRRTRITKINEMRTKIVWENKVNAYITWHAISNCAEEKKESSVAWIKMKQTTSIKIELRIVESAKNEKTKKSSKKLKKMT